MIELGNLFVMICNILHRSTMDGLHKFLIMDKSAGICIYDQTFEELPCEIPTDLLGGFLIAILGFSEELIKNQTVEYIQMKQIRVQFHIEGRLVMAVIASNSTDPEYIQNTLKILQKKFSEKYAEQIKRDYFCDVTCFHNFASEVASTFQKETKYLGYVQKRSDQLRDYIQASKKDWDNLQQLFAERAKSFGSWVVKESLDQDDIINIQETRSALNLNHINNDKPKKRTWV